MRIALLASIGVSWSRETALRLAELGHSVHVIDFEAEVEGNYLRGRRELYEASLTTLRHHVASVRLIRGGDISQWRYLRYAPQLRKIYRNIGGDILLSLWGGGFGLISWASGIRPYAVFLGGGDVLRVSGVQKLASRHVLNCAAITFANGRYFGEKAQAFAPGAHVHPLYLGVDPTRFVPGSSPPEPVVVLCTRGFLPVYNNEYLIEALSQMRADALPDFRMIFTSAGESLPKVRTLADRILPPTLRHRVRFLDGVTDAEMLEHLQGAHIFASMARYDGTSISMLEALACGLYPVLSDIPQNREWIDPMRQNGALVPLDQPAALARALEAAIRDAGHREDVRAYNRAQILERADGRKTIAEMATLMENAVGHRT